MAHAWASPPRWQRHDASTCNQGVVSRYNKPSVQPTQWAEDSSGCGSAVRMRDVFLAPSRWGVLQVVYLLAKQAGVSLLLLVAITYPPPSLNHLPVHSGPCLQQQKIDTAARCRAATWWRSKATSIIRTAGTGQLSRKQPLTAPLKAVSRHLITRRLLPVQVNNVYILYSVTHRSIQGDQCASILCMSLRRIAFGETRINVEIRTTLTSLDVF